MILATHTLYLQSYMHYTLHYYLIRLTYPPALAEQMMRYVCM